MGKLKRMLGYSAWLGNRRRLDELLGMKDIYENNVRKKIRDWKEAEKCIPVLDAKIAELREKIAREED
ncbi:MAG: hypothetical protein ACREAK_00800 [Nitrosarchaeum sp.]